MDVFSLGDKAGNRTIRVRSLPLVTRLNLLYRADHMPQLSVVATGVDSARIVADGQTVIDVLPGDVLQGTPDALSTARIWAGALSRALQKGPGATR